MWRSCSQATISGTSLVAAGTSGLEIIPAVLMVGIEEEFFISFRAENGTFHHAGHESEAAHGALDADAGGLVEGRVTNDSALAHLPLADLELGLDQYNHSAGRLEQ